MENNQLKAENEALKEKISKTSDSHTSDEWKEANDRVNVLIKENDLLLDQNRSQQEELGKLRSEHLELSKNGTQGVCGESIRYHYITYILI